MKEAYLPKVSDDFALDENALTVVPQWLQRQRKPLQKGNGRVDTSCAKSTWLRCTSSLSTQWFPWPNLALLKIMPQHIFLRMTKALETPFTYSPPRGQCSALNFPTICPALAISFVAGSSMVLSIRLRHSRKSCADPTSTAAVTRAVSHNHSWTMSDLFAVICRYTCTLFMHHYLCIPVRCTIMYDTL